MCHSFEIFHIREPDIPVDTIEIKGTSILSFFGGGGGGDYYSTSVAKCLNYYLYNNVFAHSTVTN